MSTNTTLLEGPGLEALFHEEPSLVGPIVGGLITGTVVFLALTVLRWVTLMNHKQKLFDAISTRRDARLTELRKQENERLAAKRWKQKLEAERIEMAKDQEAASSLLHGLQPVPQAPPTLTEKQRAEAAARSVPLDMSPAAVMRRAREEVERIALLSAPHRSHPTFDQRLQNRPAREHFVRAQFQQEEPSKPSAPEGNGDEQWQRHHDASIDMTVPSTLVPRVKRQQLNEGAAGASSGLTLPTGGATLSLETASSGAATDTSAHAAAAAAAAAAQQLSGETYLLAFYEPVAPAGRELFASLTEEEKAHAERCHVELDAEAQCIVRGMVSMAAQHTEALLTFHKTHARSSHTSISKVCRFHVNEHSALSARAEAANAAARERKRHHFRQAAETEIIGKSGDEARVIIAKLDAELKAWEKEQQQQLHAQHAKLREVQTARGVELEAGLQESYKSGSAAVVAQSLAQYQKVPLKLEGIAVAAAARAGSPAVQQARDVLAAQLSKSLENVMKCVTDGIVDLGRVLAVVRVQESAAFAALQMKLSEEEFHAIEAHEVHYSDALVAKYNELAVKMEALKKAEPPLNPDQMKSHLRTLQRELDAHGLAVAEDKHTHALAVQRSLIDARTTSELDVHTGHDESIEECRKRALYHTFQRGVDAFLARVLDQIVADHEEVFQKQMTAKKDACLAAMATAQKNGDTDAVARQQKELDAFAVELTRQKQQDAYSVQNAVHHLNVERQAIVRKCVPPEFLLSEMPKSPTSSASESASAAAATSSA